MLLWEAARPQQVSAVERTGLIEQILQKVRTFFVVGPPLHSYRDARSVAVGRVVVVISDASIPRCCSCLQADGKYIELANNHTASRIMQFCFKSGKPEQRDRVIAQVTSFIALQTY